MILATCLKTMVLIQLNKRGFYKDSLIHLMKHTKNKISH